MVPAIAWAAPPHASVPSEARPWDWTAEERIRERYDPEGIELRRQREADPDRGGVPTAPGFQVIDGSDDPELFFEWELFDALLARGFGPEPRAREIFREQIEANLSAAVGFEMPPGFWRRLAATAEDLLSSLDAQRALAADLPGASDSEAAEILAAIDELQADGCRMRRAASLAMEEELGRRTFLRVLYQGVAPGTVLSESTSEGRGDILRFVQQGCP